MKRITLLRGQITLVDDADFVTLSQHLWHYVTPGYVVRNVHVGPDHRRHTERMHRVILGAQLGEVVDHINGDGLDNRRENLRLASHQENTWNQKKRPGRSIYKGVSWLQGMWGAHIRVDNVLMYLGRFPTQAEAAEAYNRAAIEHFGEFARLNDTSSPPLEDQPVVYTSTAQPRGSSQYWGVHWYNRGRVWRAQIQHKGRNLFLGVFELEEDAAHAYDKAARELHGDRAHLNFPD